MTDKQISFEDLWISKKILKKIEEKWYKNPSPIQAAVIPLLLNWEKDIIWQAQTGTWKTASFAIPILEKIKRNKDCIQALILTPTRELAIQVAEEIKSFTDSGELKIQLLYGWQNIRNELAWLKNNPQIVVGTPGRVIDHLIKKKSLNVEEIKYFVLDEADEMLNIGFKDDIEEIISHTPEDKKVLLFSATLPKGIQEIVKKYIKDHDKVAIKKEEKDIALITQKYYKVWARDKFEALCRVIEVEFDFYWILFCKTKLDVDEVTSKLLQRWFKAEGIHWDIEQRMREKTLARFKNGTIKILVATDVAARWIDVNNLTHVINYALPDNPETYTHRIWRTWRAGNSGIAISFVTRNDTRMLSYINRATGTIVEEEKLPKISELLEFKKKRLVWNIKNGIEENKEELQYLDLAKDILELSENKEEILASLLKEVFKDEFTTKNYIDLKEESFSSQDRKERGERWERWNRWERGERWYSENGQRRLFVAKWKFDNMTPWSLIKFIEKEMGAKLWDVGSIDIMREFSFINLSDYDASSVLKFFKNQNPSKPLIVEAKSRDSWGSNERRKTSYRGDRKSNSRFGDKKRRDNRR